MGTIRLDHGRGGSASEELLGDLFLKHLSSPVLHCLEDSALLEEHAGRLAFSTDCYIDEPLFFPGGNIGTLAINTTINNLAMRGAMPLALSLGIIIEEGFPIDDLEKIIRSIGESTEYAEVAVVAGDTKVVPRGKINGLCLNTSGIGLVNESIDISGANVEVGDTIILSGCIGEHGLAVRGDGESGVFCASDSKPLHFMIKSIIESFPDSIHALRDPTRGGLATSLVWLASSSAVCMEIEESAIPITEGVRQACEKEGLDPLYLSNEGCCILCCESEEALDILTLLRKLEGGHDACIIGHVSGSPMGRVKLFTEGKFRFLDAL